MVEIDKLKKINELANELKKHNFAETSDDAVKLAENFYNDKTDKEEGKQDSAEIGRDYLSERKFELMIQIQEKKFQQELDHLRSTINFLKNRMEILSTELENLKGKALSSPITFEKQKENAEVQANLKKEKEEKKEQHPKSGEFSSHDVDIQKMFYFGNK